MTLHHCDSLFIPGPTKSEDCSLAACICLESIHRTIFSCWARINPDAIFFPGCYSELRSRFPLGWSAFSSPRFLECSLEESPDITEENSINSLCVLPRS